MKTLKESILNRSNHTGEGFKARSRELIEKWLKEYNIRNYTINDDFTIDVDGDVNLVWKKLTEFPDYIQFGVVKGNFNCYNNQLTSLKGAPKDVYKHFNCNNNKLSSLEGVPREVYGDFICSNNQLTSLEGVPKDVESVDCSNNQLTSLEGAPKDVYNFYCNYNKLTTLKGAPKRVRKDFDCSDNTTQFTNNDVKAVCTVEGSIYT